MTDDTLASTVTLFLAMGDPTRLRLLNLMCEGEVCVSSFTTVLGQSQPLVSRHLAYLRNAGVVGARRDGKWIHYSVSSNLDDNTQRLLTELFKWMEGQAALSEERARYYATIGEPVPPRKHESRRVRSETSRRTNKVSPFEEHESVEVRTSYAYDDASPYHEPVHHNELEDFLL